MAMNKAKRSLYNLVYSFLGQIITVCLGFMLPRLFVVNYGSEVNGLLNSLSQIFVYMGLFEAGIGAVSLQALYNPVATKDHERINGILAATHKYYKRTGTLYFFSLLALSLLYPLAVKSELSYGTVCFVILFYGMSNVILFFFQGKYKILLQAEGKNYIIINLSTIVTIGTSIAKIVCIYLNLNIVLIMATTFAINMLQAIFIMCYIHRKYRWLHLDVIPDLQAINQKNAMLIHQLAGMIFQNTDVLILTFVCDLKAVSVYSMYKLVVMNVSNILNLGINSVGFAFGQIYSTNKERFKKIIDIFETYYSAVAFSVFVVVLCLYTPFMKLYTANVTDINYVDIYLPWLFVLIELLTVMRTPMLNTINYAGHFKATLSRTIIETIINLGVSLFMVFVIGIPGVLIGTITALLYRTTDIIIYTNKKILDRTPMKTFFIYLIDIGLFVLLYSVFCHIGLAAGDSYIKLLY
ncbi:MAG: sugar isomerase, partial [Clostridia bacterium]|nr:sugar isomerase [Clostridia bacterium]